MDCVVSVGVVLGQLWTDRYLYDGNWVSRGQQRINGTGTGAIEYCSVLVKQVLRM